MSLVLADRVRETTTSTGTGTITLGGAVSGFQSFSVIGNNNTTYYTIAGTSQWEVGIGTYYGGTLTRDTVLSSSTGSKIDFSAGSKDVFVTYPAGKSVNEDANNRVLIPYTSGTTNVGSLNVGDATGHTDSGVIAGFTASEPLYLYTSLQNTNTGATSYASYAVNDGGHTAYGELGINNANYSYLAAGFPNNGFSTPLASFVESYGGPLVLGSWDSQKISFIVNGAVSTTDAMTINTNGSVAFNGQVGTVGQVLQSNATSAPTWVTPASGTVTSVSGTGTVSGLTLTGTVTSSGNLTLGGTLDLSSPPAIGGTSPAAGTFTTLIGGGGSANYEQITGGTTGNVVQFQSLGSDANVSLAIQPKGTGAIDLAAGSKGVNISNGGTVTAITRNAVGSGYTSFPTWTASAPTTSGGTTASGSVNTMFSIAATIAGGGTGYTVSDVITVVGGTPTTVGATFTVTAVSSGVITSVSALNFGAYTALPTNPVSVTGGTGSGATLNVTYGVSFGAYTITTAGSGYVEQPTITVSGGGGSGATAYATVGSASIIKGLGTSTVSSTTSASIVFQTPNTAVPALVLRDAAGIPDSFLAVTSNTSYVNVFSQGNANAILKIGSNGTGSLYLNTNGLNETNQMRVSHTASAVNYVQVTGAATGSNPIISTAGSDGNIGMTLTTKGTFGLTLKSSAGGNIFTATHGNSATSNYLTFGASISGSQPTISVANSVDADVDIVFTPKGAGAVRFGTYTASVLSPTGYITIKDSGGTSRRLLVG